MVIPLLVVGFRSFDLSQYACARIPIAFSDLEGGSVDILFNLMAKHSSKQSVILHYDVGDKRFIKVTERCNLNCKFCPKQNLLGSSTKQFPAPKEPSLTEIIDSVCATGNCREVIFSGLGEPTYRLYDILKAARYLKSKGVRAVLHTNGLADRIHDRPIAPDLEDNIDAINISLNAHCAEAYDKVCRPEIENAFQSVTDFIRNVREYVPEVSVSATRGLPEVNMDACRELANELGVRFQERLITQPC